MVILLTVQNTLNDDIISLVMEEEATIEGIKLTILAEKGIEVGD
jgi:hypothetical protein